MRVDRGSGWLRTTTSSCQRSAVVSAAGFQTEAGPESGSEQFDLKSGRKVQGRVVDDTGQPVPGACVVLNLWHVHTDEDGNFDWSLEGPEPKNIEIRAYKRYDGRYQEFKGTETFSQIERQLITIPRNR
jgi:protocatechuate 3,4-dioxygenase beta subunit